MTAVTRKQRSEWVIQPEELANIAVGVRPATDQLKDRPDFRFGKLVSTRPPRVRTTVRSAMVSSE